jgi:hypothetical protein
MNQIVQEGMEIKFYLIEIAQPEPSNVLSENVMIEIDEKISAVINKDGDISKFEIKGILYALFNDPTKCHC